MCSNAAQTINVVISEQFLALIKVKRLQTNNIFFVWFKRPFFSLFHFFSNHTNKYNKTEKCLVKQQEQQKQQKQQKWLIGLTIAIIVCFMVHKDDCFHCIFSSFQMMQHAILLFKRMKQVDVVLSNCYGMIASYFFLNWFAC